MNQANGTAVTATREPVSRRGGDPLFVFLAGTAGAVLLAIAAVLVAAAGAGGLLIAGGAAGMVALTALVGERIGGVEPVA